jgi:hypothetical protein
LKARTIRELGASLRNVLHAVAHLMARTAQQIGSSRALSRRPFYGDHTNTISIRSYANWTQATQTTELQPNMIQ